MTSRSSSPPAKHQRTDNASITRSEIWHRDGSVVLQADDVQFRVHWSVLALHSSFFRDMQELPQPSDQPSVDGCPIIELQDAVEDVKYLLEVLYDPTFLLEKVHTLPLVAALIRLGRKYDFRKLLDAAVAWLTLENPTTLDEYDARLAHSGHRYAPKHLVNYPGIVFDVLALAREKT
ncbi:hypothetical protein B0H17DRAFT_1136823 [Mycena rosella]|uniref:BTB domain-containing protein n=1 Tax=Mycena rosella TaxID=1033263 RepID=A0AAD7D9N1_MYCRO|nr:hypothetical protein B0H17DRAFT_1136823 [Mycena rosella]